MEEKGKTNCWEFKKCGREQNGRNAKELGVCPATEEAKLDGVHGGKNAGRSCWILSQTLCEGKVQGAFAQKYKTCQECDFYQNVKREEFPKFMLSAVLLRKLGQWPESE